MCHSKREEITLWMFHSGQGHKYHHKYSTNNATNSTTNIATNITTNICTNITTNISTNIATNISTNITTNITTNISTILAQILAQITPLILPQILAFPFNSGQCLILPNFLWSPQVRENSDCWEITVMVSVHITSIASPEAAHITRRRIWNRNTLHSLVKESHQHQCNTAPAPPAPVPVPCLQD